MIKDHTLGLQFFHLFLSQSIIELRSRETQKMVASLRFPVRHIRWAVFHTQQVNGGPTRALYSKSTDLGPRYLPVSSTKLKDGDNVGSFIPNCRMIDAYMYKADVPPHSSEGLPGRQRRPRRERPLPSLMVTCEGYWRIFQGVEERAVWRPRTENLQR